VATQTFHVFGVLIMCESAQLILHSKATITMYLKFVSDAHPVHVDDIRPLHQSPTQNMLLTYDALNALPDSSIHTLHTSSWLQDLPPLLMLSNTSTIS